MADSSYLIPPELVHFASVEERDQLESEWCSAEDRANLLAELRRRQKATVSYRYDPRELRSEKTPYAAPDWGANPPWECRDPNLDDLIRIMDDDELGFWFRGGGTKEQRQELLSRLDRRWQGWGSPKREKSSSPRSTEERDRKIQEILRSYQRGLDAMAAEDAAIAKHKSEAAEEWERIEASRRAADERLHGSFDRLRSGLDGAIETASELLRRKQQRVDPADTLKELVEGMRTDVDGLASIYKTRTSQPEPPRRKINIWGEIKNHRGWYFVGFLLAGLPVGIATIWPTLTDEKVPHWLAEHGWPQLTTLVIAWVAIAAIIALVIIARSCQTALRSKGDESR